MTKLINLCTKIGSGATPKGGKNSYLGGSISLIRSQNVLHNDFTYEGLVYINDDQASKLSNVLIEEDDVLLNITGDSVARCCNVPKEVIPARVNQHVMIIRTKKDVLCPYFLKYFLISKGTQDLLLNLSSAGATRKALTKAMIENLEIIDLNINTQKSISNFLKTFDLKIQKNILENNLLKETTETIFKSWFINFDPVRSKTENRTSGLSEEINKLFPNKFINSEIGEIPEGWEVVNLTEVFDIQGGSQPPAKTFKKDIEAGYIRLLQIRDYDKTGHETYIPVTKNLRIVNEDDVLIGRYGSGNGKFMQDSLGRPLRGLSGAINVAVVRTIPKVENSREYIYNMVSSGYFYNQIVGGSARAVQAGFKKEDLQFIKIALPPQDILSRFEKLGVAIWERRKLFENENNVLSKIRDTLLPKLISGELKIPDAYSLIENKEN